MLGKKDTVNLGSNNQSSAKHKKPHQDKLGKKKLLISIVALVVALAVGGFFVVNRSQNESSQEQTTDQRTEAERAADELAKQAEEREKAFENAPNTSREKYENLQKQIAALPSDKENAPENLQLYMDAAFLADELKEQARAKEYAQKALDIFEKLDEYTQEFYKATINSLERVAQ